MIKFYNYIYSNLYKWISRLKYDKSPHITAFFTISILTWLNLLSIFAFVGLFIERPTNLEGIRKLEMAVIIILFAVPQWFYLMHKNRYEKIIGRSKNTAKDSLFTFIYILFSLGLFFGSLFLLMLQNQSK
jgi:hypothetical protein